VISWSIYHPLLTRSPSTRLGQGERCKRQLRAEEIRRALIDSPEEHSDADASRLVAHARVEALKVRRSAHRSCAMTLRCVAIFDIPESPLMWTFVSTTMQYISY
jgi:hypothetical protein